MKPIEIVKTFPNTTFVFFMLIAIAIMLTTGCEKQKPSNLPHRISVTSQTVTVGDFCEAKVIKDSETGHEFLVITNTDGPAVVLIPPKTDVETER